MAYTLPVAAEKGFYDASAYDAHRPSYPDAAVDQLLEHLGLAGSSRELRLIVELGAGTGKFTQVLSQRAVTASWTIIAVEPHAQMRARLAAKNLPHVTVVGGHAAALRSTVADGTADAVVAAQAFHWFAHAEALAEIRSVLKPSACFGVIWNIEDYNKPAAWPAHTPWEQELNDLIFALAHDDQPRFRDGQWQQAFVDASTQGLFGPLADRRTEWPVQLTPDALWQRLQTLSQVANLPEEDLETSANVPASATPQSRRAVRQRLDMALARPDAVRNDKGEVAVHVVTYFAWAQKI